jgi:acyl-coenzyme A synthetase/AMP-(fatty) acid ligase/aryl carrier-like protein
VIAGFEASLRAAQPALLGPGALRLDGGALVRTLRRLAEHLDDVGPATAGAPPRRLVVDPGGIEGALVILASVFSAPTAVIPSGNPDLRSMVLDRHRPDVVVDAAAAAGLVRHALGDAVQSTRADGATVSFENGHGQLLLPTSGTTGEPKIVVIRAAQLLHSARAVGASLALTPADATLAVMPLNHVHGVVASVLGPLLSGGSVVIADGFSASEATAVIDEHRVNWITAVPSILQLLLHESLRTGWLPTRPFRFLRSASSALPPSLLERLEDRFGCPVIEAYGMTEAAHEIASNRPDDRVPGSVGRPSGCSVTVLDEHSSPGSRSLGELAIRGEQVTDGYLGAPPRADDAWLPTGDLGWIDEHGRIWIHGRSKEVINRSGETIAPRIIEDALLRLDGVVRAIAFSIPDDHHGEVPAASVVMAEGHAFDERSLRHGLLGHLHHRHVPVGITRVDELPLGRTGKPDRLVAAQRYQRQWPRMASMSTASDPGQDGAATLLRLVGGAWSTLFGRAVADDESFVDLGGDSLLALALAAHYEDAGLPLTILDFATSVTIRSHAALASRIVG